MIPSHVLWRSLAVTLVHPPRLTHSSHITHHTSHAFISIPAFDTPDDWGLGGGVAAAAAAAAGAGAGAAGAGAISILGTIWRRGSTPPICFGPFHPRSSAPVGRIHSPSQTHPRLATPARLNTARYKSPTRDSAHLLFRFSLLSSGLCSRSSTRFLTPAPVATQRSLQNSGSKHSRVFNGLLLPSSRVSNLTLSPFPIPSNSPALSSSHTLHRAARPHPRGLPSSGHTTPSNLALDAYRRPRFCVSDLRHGLITLVSAFDLGRTDLLTLESFFSRA